MNPSNDVMNEDDTNTFNQSWVDFSAQSAENGWSDKPQMMQYVFDSISAEEVASYRSSRRGYAFNAQSAGGWLEIST
jgi:hypothetical protein